MAKQYSAAVWAQVRKDYATSMTLKAISEKYGMSVSAINQRKKRDNWAVSKYRKKRKKSRLTKNKEARIQKQEQIQERWDEMEVQAKNDLIEASTKAISEFKEKVDSGEMPVEDWRQLLDVIKALDRGLDKQEGQGGGMQFGINVNLLSSAPKPIEV